ncbi:MAG: hypothetical protein KKF54_00950, partial [Candidatus Omnitrophica bacterium]|nr:hypothetical protein [Candidatus Omnitrophota bacterium]
MLSWDERQKKIEEVFRDYSIHDTVVSLLCSCLWLPNISSQIKHIYLTALLISRNPAIFQKDNQITDYDGFSRFMSRLIPLLPSFPTAEDYFPESDWGEVKFFFKDKIYKIFYGNEITDIYDYLSMFEIMYVSSDGKYMETIGRSPSEELSVCLKLQDNIISIMPQSISEEKLKSIHLGHYEIPEEQFWQVVNNNFQYTKSVELGIPEPFIKNYSIEIGTVPFPDSKDFIEAVIYGRLAQYFFLSAEGSTYLLNPRRYSCILLEEWYQLYKTNKDKLFEKKEHENFPPSAALGQYINQRIKGHNKFTVVSAIHENNRPHATLFSFAMIYDNKLLLFCLLKPDELNVEKKVVEVEEALTLIQKQPHTIGLHLKRQNVQFHSKGKQKLSCEVIVLHPNICIQGIVNSIKIPESFSGMFMGMTDFLAIFDEVQSIDEFIEFCEYIKKDTMLISPMASLLDRYAAFKDSNKIINRGAKEFNLIMLDPHWGSAFKYEKLKKFWSLYPDRNYFDHPRSWNPIKESETMIRLDARGYRGCALFTKVEDIHFFFTAPFDDMNYEEARITNMLLMCLEDYFSKSGQKLKIFQQYKEFNINIFPDSLIQRESDKFKHLNQFAENLKTYNGQAGYIRHYIPGARVVYSLENITKKFMECTDNTNEVDLFLYIAGLLNGLCPDSQASAVLDEISKDFKGKKPRYKLHQIDMKVCFDHFSGQPISAEAYDFKKARKVIAYIAKELKIEPGEYNLDDAKKLINAVREKAVQSIDTLIKEFDFCHGVIILVKNIEKLMHHTKTDLELIERSATLDVDYDRTERYAKLHSDYLATHRNYRYLIEKFVQHNANGAKKIKVEDIKYLLAFSDEIHILYEASDLLHYGIEPLGLEVSDDYLFHINDKFHIEEKGRTYGEYLATHQIYADTAKEISNRDRDGIEKYLDELDIGFKSELLFTFRNFLNVCDVLATWPNFYKEVIANDSYSATKDIIVEICIKNLKNASSKELNGIIDFLVLEHKCMLSIIGDRNSAHDLPVWEINKRPYRYIVKPLIKIGEKILWGPYSIDKTQQTWLNRLMNGDTPFDLRKPKIMNIIDKRKQAIEQKIVQKAFDIIRQFTSSVDKE